MNRLTRGERLFYLILLLVSLAILAFGVVNAADFWTFGGPVHQAVIHACDVVGALGVAFAGHQLTKE